MTTITTSSVLQDMAGRHSLASFGASVLSLLPKSPGITSLYVQAVGLRSALTAFFADELSVRTQCKGPQPGHQAILLVEGHGFASLERLTLNTSHIGTDGPVGKVPGSSWRLPEGIRKTLLGYSF